ncbi:MAG: hypothetical protein HPY69_16190 [Armatimonadetes bacterium]|nr:hypothetical protein [Armatimonadota bacterium]
MQAEHVAPIFASAFDLLASTGANPHRCGLSLLAGSVPVPWEVVSLVQFEGDLQGTALCGVSRATALRLRPALGLEADPDGLQTVAELVRQVCDSALLRLEEAGLKCRVSAPTTLADCQRLPSGSGVSVVLAITSDYGLLDLGVSLQRVTDAVSEAGENAA